LGLLLLEMCGQGVLYVKRAVFQPACRHPNEATCPLAPFQSDQTEALISDPFTGYSWQPGYQGEWLSINSLGFRGAEISTAKPEGTLRVAVVGGSAAFGVGVHDDETIEAYLATALSERLGRPVEVINGAVTSFNSSQELSQILFRIMPLDPDVIIVYDGRNDIYFGLSPVWEPHYPPRPARLSVPSGQPQAKALLANTCRAFPADPNSDWDWSRSVGLPDQGASDLR